MRGSVRVRRVSVLCLALVRGPRSSVVVLAALTAMSGPADATAAPALDNFECYSATATSTRRVAGGVRQHAGEGVDEEQARDRQASSAAPGAVQMHCNPVQKTVRVGWAHR